MASLVSDPGSNRGGAEKIVRLYICLSYVKVCAPLLFQFVLINLRDCGKPAER